MNKLCIVIPMKSPSRSKQRLASCLLDQERETLAIGLFTNTLAFFHYHFPELPVLVVSESEYVLKLAENYGALTLFDSGVDGLNGALTSATNWIMNAGFTRQLIIPSDIALLERSEINTLLRAANVNQVVIARAKDGGTNALLLSPPNVIPFSYGQDSANLHEQKAKDKDCACSMLHLENFSLDIDNQRDLYQAAKYQPHRYQHWVNNTPAMLTDAQPEKARLYA